jgi:hypothetical protein
MRSKRTGSTDSWHLRRNENTWEAEAEALAEMDTADAESVVFDAEADADTDAEPVSAALGLLATAAKPFPPVKSLKSLWGVGDRFLTKRLRLS